MIVFEKILSRRCCFQSKHKVCISNIRPHSDLVWTAHTREPSVWTAHTREPSARLYEYLSLSATHLSQVTTFTERDVFFSGRVPGSPLFLSPTSAISIYILCTHVLQLDWKVVKKGRDNSMSHRYSSPWVCFLQAVCLWMVILLDA